MCLHVHLWGKGLWEKGEKSKAVCVLTQRFLPLLHRAKYFHGKKVNGEVEIRVEQVGSSGVFSTTTLTFSVAGAISRSNLGPHSYVAIMSQDFQKNSNSYLGVSLNSRIIWSSSFQPFCFSSRTFLQRKSQVGANSTK